MWSLGRRRGQDRHHFHEPNRGAAGPACPSGFGPVDPNKEFYWFLIYLDVYSARMKHAVLIFLLALPAFAQSTAPLSTTTKPDKIFDEVADSALASMTKRAQELKIHGAAVVAFIEGNVTQSWSSKMVVVGSMKDTPTEKSHGNNLLAIAYAKAAEMAETLKDSGHAGRPPMTGETGWQGGLIKKGKTGYLIAAFSGGPSESDLKVSQAGLEVLAEKL